MDELRIDLTALDARHRQALEDVIGRPLPADQTVMISVTESRAAGRSGSRPVQTLEDWTTIYEGLTDQEIEEIDRVAKTRANLSRKLP